MCARWEGVAQARSLQGTKTDVACEKNARNSEQPDLVGDGTSDRQSNGPIHGAEVAGDSRQEDDEGQQDYRDKVHVGPGCGLGASCSKEARARVMFACWIVLVMGQTSPLALRGQPKRERSARSSKVALD